jgi:hypothetical protein
VDASKKTCLRCQESLLRAAFQRDSTKRDGLCCYCRECVAERDLIQKLKRKRRNPVDQLLRTPLVPRP